MTAPDLLIFFAMNPALACLAVVLTSIVMAVKS